MGELLIPILQIQRSSPTYGLAPIQPIVYTPPDQISINHLNPGVNPTENVNTQTGIFPAPAPRTLQLRTVYASSLSGFRNVGYPNRALGEDDDPITNNDGAIFDIGEQEDPCLVVRFPTTVYPPPTPNGSVKVRVNGLEIPSLTKVHVAFSSGTLNCDTNVPNEEYINFSSATPNEVTVNFTAPVNTVRIITSDPNSSDFPLADDRDIYVYEISLEGEAEGEGAISGENHCNPCTHSDTQQQGQTYVGNPINTQDGNYTYGVDDISIIGDRGRPITFRRVFNQRFTEYGVYHGI
nr:hypothetical protein [Anaerolineae bacterium]